MSNERSYPAGVVTALTSLSQGTCYWPDCDEPIVRFVDGQPVNNFEIAHIRAVKRGGPRYVEGLDRSFVNSFLNLVLLCLPHHKTVDKLRPYDFSIEELEAWKRAREKDGRTALRGLRDLSEEKLQVMISDSIALFKQQMTELIRKVEQLDATAAHVLKPLIAELAEVRTHRRWPNEDTATYLVQAGRDLRGLPDAAPLIVAAAKDLNEVLPQIRSLTNQIRGLRQHM